MQHSMKRRLVGSLVALAGSGLIGGCSAQDDAGTMESTAMGSAEQSVAACAGDDVNYDYNAFAASLAVAIADELERWDVNADFELRSGKLELSATGTARCAAFPDGCGNTIALLRLQDDAAASVPNHSPAVFRSKLVTWYSKQTQILKSLVDRMLTVDKGVYKIKARHSGKYMAVDNSSTLDGAIIEQRGSVTYAGADEWRLILQNTKHRFQNIRSGKCLTLEQDSSADVIGFVQRTCSPTLTTQNFELAGAGDAWAIRTKYLKALDVNGGSQADDARLIQYTWDGNKTNQKWELVPVGSAQHLSPRVVATAVYYLTVKHSGHAIGVDGGLMNDNAVIEQRGYVASDDRFHWYVTPLLSGYQFINRKSGKCLALASDTDTAPLVQKTCAPVATQAFGFQPTGADGYSVLYSVARGRPLEIANASLNWDTPLVQAATGDWNDNRMLRLNPVIAGEPHRLTFSHKTNDATCGEYNYWYEIAQPNGDPLHAPADSYVQLIFAGGKETLTGKDVNPFIAQRVSGDLVAIDPTYGLNEDGLTTSGSCTAACTKITKESIAGRCCSCNGATKTYKKSTWNAMTYLCQ
jgi:hypothetical protein